MAENDVIMDVEHQPEQLQPVHKKDVGGAVKEWFRKRVVALKRAPHMIALVMLLVTTVYFMLILFPLSNAIYACNKSVVASGICQFVITLLSLLVLVSYLNAFPKRKKPNIFFIVLVFVMIGAMIACNVVIINEVDGYLVTVREAIKNAQAAGDVENIETLQETAAALEPVHGNLLVHIILLAVSAGLFALLPAYKKLINMINTKVELESATENMQGSIDIQED